MSVTPEYDDIQGLVRFGHRRQTQACFYLLRIADLAAARAWLQRAPVTDAVARDPPPETALHVALTAEALRALGTPEPVIAGFSAEFIAGMSGDANRSHRLGDTGANEPAGWRWGGPGRVPHLLAMVYATPARFEAWKGEITAGVWASAFSVIECLATTDLDGREPFGFADGISQPAIDWSRTGNFDSPQLEYRNLSALGEFLLGYPNEYGKYTDRPLIDPAAPAAAMLPPAEDMPDRRDLGRNGTYLVLRDLSQDVAGFWHFLGQQSGTGQSGRALAEAMVGRRMDGSPLVSAGGVPIIGYDDDTASAANDFTFADDPDGVSCPFGAHIRRANPRNPDMPGGPGGALSRLVRTLGFGRQGVRGDLVAPVRFHRLLRRGRAYGPRLTPQQARAADDGAERGIRFVALNANISRQFEFVQNAWMAGAKFDGLIEESDPLLGIRQPVAGTLSDSFTYSRAGAVRRRLCALPRFVTVRGGAYFFLPGIKALRYLATAGSSRLESA